MKPTFVLAVSTLTLIAALSPAQSLYSVVDIGALIDPSGAAVPSRSTGLDSQGRVVGTGGPTNTSNGFIYSNGAVSELTLGYPHTVLAKMSDNGQATGNGSPDSSSLFEAFRYEGGAMIRLGTNGNGFSHGNDVNNGGTVVGYAGPNRSSNATDALRWNPNGTVDVLPTLGGGFGRANAINNLGAIVGETDTDTPFDGRHAFLYQNGSIQDLGALGTGDASSAYGVNDSGVVVGTSNITVFNADGTHAFRWQNGTMEDLGTLGGLSSYAFDINASGVIVGSSLTVVEGSTVQASHGFVYINGAMVDLNTLLGPGSSEFLIQGATAINDSGQIAAFGVQLLPNGSTLSKAFLLNPVPEPATLAVLGLGIAALVRRRARRAS